MVSCFHVEEKDGRDGLAWLIWPPVRKGLACHVIARAKGCEEERPLEAAALVVQHDLDAPSIHPHIMLTYKADVVLSDD